ncbi:MAG TPA: hypothetical protein VMW41_05370 [Candidatus Bathyarchaeia archaeon]|nr:hypothetical protein [Candidatus Bathyarchaeia archaeon]
MISQFLAIVKFLSFFFFLLFAPGELVLSWLKVKLTEFERPVVALSLGIVILTLASFVLRWLHLNFLLWPLLFFAGFCFLRRKWQPILRKPASTDWLIILLILGGSIFQSLVMIKSGTNYQGGIAFWGVHGHDGLWHATLIQELAQDFPGQNPGFAGETLKNYHYFFDLFAAETYRLTKIPILNLYFRYLPIFLAFLLNSLVYIFASRWSGRKSVGCWAVFFNAFASSFGFLLPFFGIGSDNWETAFWAMQPATSLQNPPFYLSLLILVLGLFLLWSFEAEKKWNLKRLTILALVFGSIIEFKVYGGLIVLVALLAIGLWQQVSSKQTNLLKVALFSLVTALVVYLPSNKTSTALVKWQPFWFVRVMIQAGDRMNWVSWELRRQVYVFYRNRLGVLLIDGVALACFIIGNLGVRSLGLIEVFKKLIRPKIIDLLLVILLAAGLLPPLFLIQEYLPWNTIQFFYYAIFITGFFTAFTVDGLIKKIRPVSLKAVMVSVLLLFSLPGSLKTISWHWGKTPTALLDRSEKDALSFVENNSGRSEVILAYPYASGSESHFSAPVPLSYYNAAYVSFFTNRRVYLEDQTAALIQDYGLEERLAKVKNFFMTTDASLANEFLKESHIKYIYLVDDQSWQADLGNKLELFYSNDRVKVYKII